jgi:hypothetical protein
MCMQYKLRAQLHEKYTWINDGVQGKKSIGSFQGTSTGQGEVTVSAVFSLWLVTSDIQPRFRSSSVLDEFLSMIFRILLFA